MTPRRKRCILSLIPLGGMGISQPEREVTVAKARTAPRAESVYITPELESDLQDRLSRIEGHVRGIKKMLAEHRDCNDILMQVSGVKAAINRVATLLLQGHLEGCVAEAVRTGDSTMPVQRFKEGLSRALG